VRVYFASSKDRWLLLDRLWIRPLLSSTCLVPSKTTCREPNSEMNFSEQEHPAISYFVGYEVQLPIHKVGLVNNSSLKENQLTGSCQIGS
jgi:hypothetical protein